MIFSACQKMSRRMAKRPRAQWTVADTTRISAFVLLLLSANGAYAASAPPLSEAELESVVAEIKATSEAAAREMADRRSERIDAMLPVENADFDPERIFQWVSKETRWVPYAGILRGAKGVLADRQGNSLDRSLLLAELLNIAGVETRLARTQLPADLASELVGLEADKPVPQGVQYPLTDKGQAVVDRAIRQTEELRKVIGISLPPDPQVPIDAMSDHWWVQAKTGQQWQDLDPLTPGSLAGKRPQPEALFAAENLPAGLPEDLFHRVTLRVVIERFENGKYVEETPVELALKTSDGTAQSISLHFEPYGADEPEDGSAWQMKNTVLADTAQDWLPVFRLDGERVTGQGFDNHGRLEANPAKPTITRKMATSVEALGNIGASSKAQQPGPVLSGCWIEYEWVQPGSAPRTAPQTVRRQIFSFRTSGGGQARDVSALNEDAKAVRERGLALLGSHRMLVTNSDLPVDLFNEALLEYWGKTGNLIAGVVRVSNDPTIEEPNQRLAGGSVYPLDLLSLAVFREALSPDAGQTYVARANIFGNHYLYDGNPEIATHVWDIVFNQIDEFPQNLRITLFQGVLDTVLESALLPVPEDAVSYNTSRLFDRQQETGPWRLMRREDVETSGFSTEAVYFMTAALAANRLVVAPLHLPEHAKAAWWEIDAQNFQTLGIGPRGWGTEGTERIGIQIPAQVQAAYTRTQGQAVCTGVAVAVTAVSLVPPDPRFMRTLPSILAQSKPLLRTHCGVQGWWTPP